MIGIIDYGMGNLRSVYNTLTFLGFDSVVVADPALLADCSRVILPGVGAYAMAVDNLNRLGFFPALKQFAQSQKPLLGICLGMQMLSSTGSEPSPCEGLGLIEGEVVPMNVGVTTPLPHVGWNSFKLLHEHPLFEGVSKEVDVYFVHSYCFKPKNERDVLCTTEYDNIIFASGVARGSVVGLQFHPEKSQKSGMRILENFCNWDGLC
ncbi:MAG: imidazole glycerol phosphate synthase subunit HisH [Verrucomicrobia bacterium]|nr:imidazole glycerol phosphate synthase subunit HisH [Verrucomicrobiota bacterium]MBU4248029.1 imidazole glycerol phosphate synthase subunit HisH [Verrucomicrobiota bacterium]MBU4289533.1 imidazole glycerol phosphate synthase subunit HisH [Verrucomicrobiota bacterium]MBU4496510.1 imidazole glycerol phosphate synthase subunit HisH [Verrucomicrobiota bacterium]MCG2678523.1 imidazole glycerol phosphate synthase subunit HisH [Kiritimatiellia bacterium]